MQNAKLCREFVVYLTEQPCALTVPRCACMAVKASDCRNVVHDASVYGNTAGSLVFYCYNIAQNDGVLYSTEIHHIDQ